MKTVVALYMNATKSHMAAEDLLENGFTRDEISIVSQDAGGEYARTLDDPAQADLADATATKSPPREDTSEGAGVGAVVGGITGLLVGLSAIAIPGIGPVVAAGSLAAGLVGAGVGAVAGGLLGALVDLGIPEEEAAHYAEGLRRGGSLLVVHTPDEKAERAAAILHRHAPIDMDERVSAWREGGWTGFDEGSDPYTPVQVEAERHVYGMHDSMEYRNTDRPDEDDDAAAEQPVSFGQKMTRGGTRIYSVDL